MSGNGRKKLQYPEVLHLSKVFFPYLFPSSGVFGLMKKIIFEPGLNKCVETLARERYWSLVDQYIRRIQKEGILEDMEMEIEALRVFLEEMDVRWYRRETEKLLERGEKVFLILEIREKGVINVVLDYKDP